MVDPIALIVPAHEARTDEIRNGAAHVAASRAAHPLAHLIVNYTSDLLRVGRQIAISNQGRAHLLDDREPAWIALCHWHQGIAEPVAQGHTPIMIDDIRPGAPAIVPGNFGDEVEDHESIARTRRDVRDPLNQFRQIEWIDRRGPGEMRKIKKVRLMEHSENLDEAAEDVNPARAHERRFFLCDT